MNTKMSLSGCDVRISVGASQGGYRVQMLVRPPMEDMYESFSHFALFADRRDAQRLANAVQRKREIDLVYWGWVPSAAAPYAELQKPSTVKYETVPRPYSNAREDFYD